MHALHDMYDGKPGIIINTVFTQVYLYTAVVYSLKAKLMIDCYIVSTTVLLLVVLIVLVRTININSTRVYTRFVLSDSTMS